MNCKTAILSLGLSLLTALNVVASPAGEKSNPGQDTPPPTIAIIIDDMGNYKDMGLRAINIPAPMTFAFLPFRPYTEEHARLAHASGKEIMLHAPMENTKSLPLGHAGLTSDMDSLKMAITFRRAIRSIPYLSGVNNHMGSALTQNRSAMNVLMKELSSYPLYFVDSRTTPMTVAYDVATEHAIPSLGRDVFLDHLITTKAIDFQFQRLLSIARKNGTAIAIGHPHKETIEYLEKAIPMLGKEGVAIATVKGIWAIRHNAMSMFKPNRKENARLMAVSSVRAKDKDDDSEEPTL
ncbi:divergent polysaccharide deacetylase family protein [Hahella ganghwensis]|uniref:divergent polysaccharide deacetylase family protein n=1 Tax=Hahella ganghwensis TaxID=286420 RepID=UPI000380C76A|nr:divergent polysaccharide deacetylase family protein [Hahella ganghwensis]